jgi:mono/diheme cytochrome c family protein
MADVVRNLSDVPDQDVRAIATYMADVFGPPPPDRKRRGEEVLAQVKSNSVPATQAGATGAAIYAAACASCHETNRSLPYGGVNLALSTAFSTSDARNAANIVLAGIRPVAGERSPIMPGFAASMSNAQIAALLDYLRARFGHQPAWAGVEKTVADARLTQTVGLQTSLPPDNPPTDRRERGKP